jgi:hypothetical protein
MTDSKMLWDFDVRVRERNLNCGSLKGDELKTYFQGLVDVQSNVETIEVRQPAFSHVEESEEADPIRPGSSMSTASTPMAPMMAPVVPVVTSNNPGSGS